MMYLQRALELGLSLRILGLQQQKVQDDHKGAVQLLVQ